MANDKTPRETTVNTPLAIRRIDVESLSEDNRKRGARLFNVLMRNPNFKSFLQGTGEFNRGDEIFPLWGAEPAADVIRWVSSQKNSLVVLAFDSHTSAFSKQPNQIDVLTYRRSDGRGVAAEDNENIVDYIKRIKS